MESEETVLYYSLNQDQDWLAVGTTNSKYSYFNEQSYKNWNKYYKASIFILHKIDEILVVDIISWEN